MKKIILSAFFGISCLLSVNAQDDSKSSANQNFGITAGYSSIIAKAKVDGASGSNNASGFYIGGFAEFELSKKFNSRPEIIYATYSQDGESAGVLLVPILFEYKANEELGLHIGPQLDYFLNEEDSEGLKRLGIGLSIGASYDISEEMFIELRYTFSLTDRLDGDLDGFEDFDVKAKYNYLNIGLGYRF